MSDAQLWFLGVGVFLVIFFTSAIFGDRDSGLAYRRVLHRVWVLCWVVFGLAALWCVGSVLVNLWNALGEL